MRILIVHTEYRTRGGEDVVVEREARCLRGLGHEVRVLRGHNADLPAPGPLTGGILAVATIWNPRWERRVRAAVASVAPDVVHVHNTFPAMSPAVVRAARAAGPAVVQTLHNYRTSCVNGLLLRDGLPCELCVGAAVPWHGVVHACYRDSRPASAAVAAMVATHRAAGTWRDVPDVVVVPGAFAARKLVEAGVLDPERLVVKPNFVSPDPGPAPDAGARRDALFVGRLSAEKGIDRLLAGWLREPLPGHRLVVVGDGPLLGHARAAADRSNGAIEVRGRLAPDAVSALMRRSLALVFASLWYEVQPTVIVEAFAHGLPVVAAAGGGVDDLVVHGENGLSVPGGPAALPASVRRLAADRALAATLSRGARAAYEARYSERSGGQALVAVYERAIASARARTGVTARSEAAPSPR